MRILDESNRNARAADHPDPLTGPVRFGRGVMLSVEDFGRANGFLNTIDHQTMQARSSARNAQMMLAHANLEIAPNVQFDPDAFVAQLNSVLFESHSISEALTK